LTSEQRTQMDTELGVESWPPAGKQPVLTRVGDRPDDTPSWYRGEEVESQEFLRAMGIELT
jgi:hypothetical protein